MNLLLTLLMISTLPSVPLQQQVIVNGRVATDSGVAVSNVRVSILGAQSDYTDSKGQFRIVLSRDFKEGERVLIGIDKKEWVIQHPLDGEWNLPNLRLQNVQHLRIFLVPRGSKKLWTHARIEKLIGNLSKELADLKKEGAKPKPVDFTYYLDQWANRYGFTPNEVKDAFDEWAAATQNSQDPYLAGLREFYNKNFAAASQNFDRAALKRREEKERYRDRAEAARLAEYENWKLSGNSLVNLYEFREALKKYDAAKALVSIEKDPQRWHEIHDSIAIANMNLGVRIEPDEGMRLLSESKEILEKSLKLLKRDEFPSLWAKANDHLGNVLRDIAIRTKGEPADQLLKQSAAAHRRALEVFSREQFPQEWAKAQTHLATTLQQQGVRTTGEASSRLLMQAVAGYRSALEIHTKEQTPFDWAETQNNLANTLSYQGVREAGTNSVLLLAEAVGAFHRALEVYTRDHSSEEWAQVQTNLGSALQAQAVRSSGPPSNKLLGDAATAYRRALEVRTFEQLPQAWAQTQNNIGITLQQQGLLATGEASQRLLSESAAAFRLAMKVYTQDALPQDWAKAQNNLGNTLREQGVRAIGKVANERLIEAVAAYRSALGVFTREHFPQYWATVQNNLAAALKQHGLNTTGESSVHLLEEAASASRLSLEVYTRKSFPQDWARTQSNLGNTLVEQALRASGDSSVRLMAEAVSAYRQALEVYTNDDFPQDWARTQYNLATALHEQGFKTKGQAGTDLLSEAISSYQKALEVYTVKVAPQYWALIQHTIALAFREQARRVSDAEALHLLTDAITAFRLALKVRTLEGLPRDWASTQYELAVTLKEKANRLTGQSKEVSLHESIEALSESLKVYTKDAQPQDWAEIQYSLAESYYGIRDWDSAARSFENALKINNQDEKAYKFLRHLYQQILFRFNDALQLNETWLITHPNDLNASISIIESEFTTGRFNQCAEHIKRLRGNKEVNQTDRILLSIIEICNLLAMRRIKEAEDNIGELASLLRLGEVTVPINTQMEGMVFYSTHSADLAPFHNWFVQFFTGLQAKNLDVIFQNLRRSRKALSQLSTLMRIHNENLRSKLELGLRLPSRETKIFSMPSRAQRNSLGRIRTNLQFDSVWLVARSANSNDCTVNEVFGRDSVKSPS
jgi:tetratricopeptide (TPR) repeat protein